MDMNKMASPQVNVVVQKFENSILNVTINASMCDDWTKIATDLLNGLVDDDDISDLITGVISEGYASIKDGGILCSLHVFENEFL